MNIGERIKELRLKNKMSQKELAEKLNAQQVAVHYWETGSRKPGLDTIKQICNVFGVTYNVLLDDNWTDYSDEINHDFKTQDGFCVTKKDIELLKKYRTLDAHGRDMVDTVLDKEQKRSPENGISLVWGPEKLLAARPDTTEPHTDEERQHDIQYVKSRRSKKDT